MEKTPGYGGRVRTRMRENPAALCLPGGFMGRKTA